MPFSDIDISVVAQWMPTVIGVLLAGAMLFFLALFLLPAIVQMVKLSRATRELEALDKPDFLAIAKIWNGDNVLGHLWEEFKDTLHEQKDLDTSTGEYRVTAIRQTVPAETYFSEQMLVHSPLRVEFFKHLPGILTGLGIIGTFTGLIAGLQGFDPTADEATVRQGMRNLLGSVSHAFVVSAFAIAMAMVVTAIEKVLVTGLYKRVEGLCLGLDRLFDAGAGEEYLARLVHASESSAKEARQLKQALVDDLKRILEEVADRQIQAQANNTSNIAKEIAAGINEGLQKPLKDISTAVQHVSGSQGEAVHKLLTDTVSAMTGQIRDLFSGQVDGIRGMQQQTVESLQIAVGELKSLIGEISRRGQETSDVMSEQLASAISAMEQGQKETAVRTQTLIDSLKSGVERAQLEGTESSRQMLEKIAATMDSAISNLSARAETSVSKTAHLTDALVRQTAEAASAIRQAVASLSGNTGETVSKMNEGATKMLQAAQQMTSFGISTGEALLRAQGLIDQLTRASGVIGGSADVLRSAVDDHKIAREILGTVVEQLRMTVEGARREVALTENILKRIESASVGLKDAQVQADKYLHDISGVLSDAHQVFGQQVIQTLAKVNGEFHRHLEQGTKALSGAIDELDVQLERIGDR